MRFSFTKLTRNICAVATAFAVAACDAGRLTNTPEIQPPAGEPAAPAASIVLTPNSMDMAVGDVVQFKASAYDQSGQLVVGRNVQWSTSQNSRVKITGNGTLEGIQVGTDTVFATLDGQTGKAALRVFVPKVIAVIVSLSSRELEVGQTAQASADLFDQKGDAVEGNVFWSSTNTAVATVDPDGRVTARAPGTAKIKAVSEGKNDSELITVVAAKSGVPGSVLVSATTSVVYIGKHAQLTAVVRDGNGVIIPNAAVAWSSSNPAVGTVSSSGDVLGVAIGTAQFTATISGKSGGTTLSVALAPISALTLALQPSRIALPSLTSSLQASVVEPSVSQAVATAYDLDGTVLQDRTVSYSSSNTSVATVSSSGTVTGLAPGTATISATSEGKTAMAGITIDPAPVAPVASLSVVLSAATVQVGSSAQALATPYDAGGQPLTGRSITWSSSNPAVATVNANGLVTAVAPGTSSVRASSEGKLGSTPISVVGSVVLVGIDISPASATLNIGESRAYSAMGRRSDGSTVAVSVAWSASGGNITQQGNYTAGQIAGHFLVIAACACGVSDTSALDILAPAPGPSPTLSSIAVAPKTVSLIVGDSVQITASALMSGSSTPVAASVVWSATGGVVSQSGKYVAGGVAGSYYVKAQSLVDATKKDSTIVTLTIPAAPQQPVTEPIAALTVAPQTTSLQTGQAFVFVANGWLSGSSTPISTPVTWTATGGTVDQSGRYVAGNVAGTFVVRARSTEVTWRIDSALVTITSSGTATPPPATPPPAAPQPTVQTFSLTPASTTLLVLGVMQFQTAVTWSDGATRSVAVTYQATGGSISAGGFYSAGLLGGVYRVIATCDCGKADTSAVTINAPVAPPLAPPPPTGGASFTSEDFNSYSSTAALLSSPKFTESQDTAYIKLDPTGGVGGSPAMRYDYVDYSAFSNRCNDHGPGRHIPVPGSTKSMWAEMYIKISTNWTALAPAAWSCTTGVDYKMVFGSVQGNAAGKWGRFDLTHNDGQWFMTTPDGQQWTAHPQAYGDHVEAPAPRTFYDGQFHRYRFEFKLSTTSTSPDGGFRIWVDNYLLIDKQGLVVDRPGFYGFKLGANLNQGPGQLQTVTWDDVKVYLSNPGW